MESLIGRLAETQFGAFLGNLIGRMHLSLSVVVMDLVVLAAHFEPQFIVPRPPPNCGDAGVLVEAGFGGTTGDDYPTPIPSPMLMFPPPEFDDFELELESSAGLLLFLLLLLLTGPGRLNPLKPFLEFIPGCCISLNIGLKPAPGPMLFINLDC